MESFSALHATCLSVFNEVAKMTAIFILPLFLGRIVFSSVVGEGSQAFSTIKSVVIYFCLIAGFPLILDVLFSIPEAYLPTISSFNAANDSAPALGDSTVLPFLLDRIVEVLLAGIYWIVYYLHIFFMLVMCSMAPIVFLTSTLLGVGLGIEIFLGLMIIGSSWPIIWYGFDQVHTALVSTQTDSFGAKWLEFLITLFKGLAPVAFASIAVKSPAGQIVSKAAQASISGGKFAFGAAVAGKSASLAPKTLTLSQKSTSFLLQKQKSLPSGNQNKVTDRLERAKQQKDKEGKS